MQVRNTSAKKHPLESLRSLTNSALFDTAAQTEEDPVPRSETAHWWPDGKEAPTTEPGSDEHWEDALAAYPDRSPEVTAAHPPFSLPGLRSLL